MLVLVLVSNRFNVVIFQWQLFSSIYCTYSILRCFTLLAGSTPLFIDSPLWGYMVKDGKWSGNSVSAITWEQKYLLFWWRSMFLSIYEEDYSKRRFRDHLIWKYQGYIWYLNSYFIWILLYFLLHEVLTVVVTNGVFTPVLYEKNWNTFLFPAFREAWASFF